ncbi:MAG: succinyl-CoA synthetase beta subunit [Clostridia bacterium]|nr:succinyl-CoA synthetase beta subunit [Clostridia bacterium]
MARLLEDQAKKLLARYGIKVPEFRIVSTADEAGKAAAELGKEVVIKALVPIGKRGKAGAVRFAGDTQEAVKVASEILGLTLSNYPVERLLVEEKLDIEQELYVSITIDSSVKKPAVIASTAGGMDVEEIIQKEKDKVKIYHPDPILGLPAFKAREIWSELGMSGKALLDLTATLVSLYRAWADLDAYLLEVNPLVITHKGEVIAAACVLGLDDSALYRHPDLAGFVQMGMERAWRPLTELEKQAVEVNEKDPYRGTARYTEMDGGDIGFMCGGGGGSLLMFDTLLEFGGKPANYSEFGGNPTAEKVYGLAKVILSKPGVRGLIVAQNITNNTQVDLVAQGLLRALKELNIDPKTFPIVVREAGVNEDEARRLFLQAGIDYYAEEVSMREAAQKIIAKMQEYYGEGSR